MISKCDIKQQLGESKTMFELCSSNVPTTLTWNRSLTLIGRGTRDLLLPPCLPINYRTPTQIFWRVVLNDRCSNWIPNHTRMLSARIPPLHARTVKSRSVSRQFAHHTTIQTCLQGAAAGDGQKRKLWSEEAMEKAVEAVLSGSCSVRRASELYQIPRYRLINAKAHNLYNVHTITMQHTPVLGCRILL